MLRQKSDPRARLDAYPPGLRISFLADDQERVTREIEGLIAELDSVKVEERSLHAAHLRRCDSAGRLRVAT